MAVLMAKSSSGTGKVRPEVELIHAPAINNVLVWDEWAGNECTLC